jgi:hypothetical protein
VVEIRNRRLISPHEAITLQEKAQLQHLATCVAFAGQHDPNNDPTVELDPHLTPAAVAQVWATPFGGDETGDTHTEQRNFGDGHEGGNMVVYLSEFMQRVLPDLFWKFRGIANDAVRAGQAAGLFVGEGGGQLPLPSALGVRVSELLQYTHGDSSSSSLGWHEDGESVYTMVMTLSKPGIDFKGGAFRMRGVDGLEEDGYDGRDDNNLNRSV